MDQFNCIFDYFQGYRVNLIGRVPAGSGEEIQIELMPDRSAPLICGRCGQRASHVHEYSERWIDDMPIFGYPTRLLVIRRRLFCPRCGPVLERLSWLDRYSRVTCRLAEAVGQVCEFLPIKHTAAMFGLNWKTVKAIDKRRLKEKGLGINLDGVRVLAMDEFAIQKGHRYATVIIEPTQRRVLWVGRGRSRESIRPFFEQLTAQQRESIEAVAMDMTAAYKLEVERHCPRARVVYDLFHVVAKYGREVIDRVRVDEANRLWEDKPARQLVKGSRWLLLCNYENIKRERDRVRLDELLAANEALWVTYVMKDDLKQLWRNNRWLIWTYAVSPLSFCICARILFLGRWGTWFESKICRNFFGRSASSTVVLTAIVNAAAATTNSSVQR